MTTGKNTGLKGQELVARLIGIRTPIGGIDWEPPAIELTKAKRVLAYLAEQQALWNPYDTAIGAFVAQSIVDVRGQLQCEVEGLPDASVLKEGLRAMHAACRLIHDMNPSSFRKLV